MKKLRPIQYLALITVLIIGNSVQASDIRQEVKLPEMMRNHMLSNMRDHLLALQEITYYLASQQYDKAADVAENRLGMSSLNSHGASHMGKFMPKEMGVIGTSMHKAASRFALAAKDAELEDDMHKAFLALSEVMEQCVACHAGYKVQ